MMAKGFNTITFLMAERAKMWVRAFMSTTFSSVSFYTCPCKSTITKTTEKNIILYFISINILSHHFKKMYKFYTFLFSFFVVISVWLFKNKKKHTFLYQCENSLKINCTVVRTLDYSSCLWPLAIRGVIRLVELTID